MFEHVIDDATNWLKNRLIYMTGRGLFGLGLIAAAGAIGIVGAATLPAWVPVLIVSVTAGLQALTTWRNERFQEGKLVDAYREEIGAALDKEPQEVGIADYRLVAEGSLHRGIRPNPVLKQALERNESKHLMQFLTTAFAGALTGLGLLMFSGGVTALGQEVDSIQQNVYAFFGVESLAGAGAALTGTLFASGLVMGLLNRALDFTGERLFGMTRTTAHERIQDIRRSVERGQEVTPQQVLGVFVATEPVLDRAIEEHFGQPYQRLNALEQFQALQFYADYLPVDALAAEINAGHIRPTELAFAAAGQRSGVARVAQPEREGEQPQQGRAVQKEAERQAEPQAEKQAPRDRQRLYIAPANDNRTGFAAHYVPRASVQAQRSFVERYAPPRQEQSGFAEREETRREETAITRQPVKS